MRIAVCDDEKKIIDSFKRIIDSGSGAGEIYAEYFTDTKSLKEACSSEAFDMVFMDVELPGDNGIKAASALCSIHTQMRFVFITAYVLEYAEKIFMGVTPYGFIGKPIDENRVNFYLKKLAKEINRAHVTLEVSESGKKYNIPMSNIVFIESEKRRLHIRCVNDEVIVYEKLDDVEKRLDDRFVRCHQSFAVNMDYISNIQNGFFAFTLAQYEPIKISYNRLSEARKKYFEYVGRSII